MSQPNRFDMSGKTVLITGGGTGLGRQFATTLAEVGATVILSARRSAPLEETAAAIRAQGGTAHCVTLDVGDGASVQSAFEQISRIGSGYVDVVINNAGTPSSEGLLDATEDEWGRVMDANLKGAWLVARAAARQMIAHDAGGSIINISSVLGSAVQKGTGSYAASKAGLLHLTRVMALEWARYRIRVNAIAPGYYLTDLSSSYLESPTGQALLKRIPQRRLGDPDELSGTILLLASDASSYLTGTVITVDGGLSLPVI